MSEERTYLGAVVGPYAAWIIARDFPEHLRSYEVKGRSLIVAGQGQAGRQMLAAVAQVREAGRQRLEGYQGEISAAGNPEVPTGGPAAGFERPPSSGLTTGEVAVKFKVSSRQVINLIAGQKLTATWVGGRWLIDEVSVATEIEQRRDRRERRSDRG